MTQRIRAVVQIDKHSKLFAYMPDKIHHSIKILNTDKRFIDESTIQTIFNV